MNDPAVFGYGSLVNLRTHAYTNPRAAQIKGWRRVWQQSATRDVAFLSVLPDANAHIDGVIADVPHGEWTALDIREIGYDRIDVTATLAAPTPTAIYQAKPAAIAPAASGKPILLSYLDVVVQGFHDHYGPSGVQRFFDTTDRWDTPVLNDRAAPQYPRHQVLTEAEKALTDHHLTRLSAVVK